MEATFLCKKCDQVFDVEGYFFNHLNQDVECPHCGTYFETEFSEGPNTMVAELTEEIPEGLRSGTIPVKGVEREEP